MSLLNFSIKDFPIGSEIVFFRKCQIQVCPYKRQKGEKKFKEDYAYSILKVTHHVGKNLVGTEYDNSNEGFCVKNSRIGEGFFILPMGFYKNFLKKEFIEEKDALCELSYLLTPNFPPVSYIIRNNKIKAKGLSSKVLWKNL